MIDSEQKQAGAVPTKEVGHITPKDAQILNSALRTAGLSLDLTATAVVYEITMEFLNKRDSMTLRDITDTVSRVMQVPEFAPPAPQPKVQE